MNGEHFEYIIRHRIEDYNDDIQEVVESGSILDRDKERIKQDQVIIQELQKILTGHNLMVLSYR